MHLTSVFHLTKHDIVQSALLVLCRETYASLRVGSERKKVSDCNKLSVNENTCECARVTSKSL